MLFVKFDRLPKKHINPNESAYASATNPACNVNLSTDSLSGISWRPVIFSNAVSFTGFPSLITKDATDLLDVENLEVLADTGYYNGTEIKNCIDDGMKVYIKKTRANNSTKDNEFRKEKFMYDKEQSETEWSYCL